jgi:Ni/Fe-hydrogenase subunit HybB-like protein
MMVGFPMVIFTILFASWSLRREPEMDVLGRLARRYVPVLLAIYLLVKVGDMLWRGTYLHLAGGGLLGMLWLIEVTLGVVAPLAMLASDRITRSARLLGLTCLMVILGVVLNRLNVFVIAYHPPYAARPYIPSLTEFMVSMGLIAALLLTYRVAVTYLPILEPRAGRVA